MADERLIAGLWCRQVLAGLSDYVEGELSPEEVAKVQAHVADCDWCERFGGQFGEVVAAIRAELREPEPVSGLVEQRLLAVLGLSSTS